MSRTYQLFKESPVRLAMPVAVYPGIALTGARVIDVVTNAQAQCAASLAIHQRYQAPVVLSAMDLSVEAEAFGCEISMSEHEIPTAVGSLVATLEQARALAVPKVGACRTGVYLETIARLAQAPGRPIVLAGSIGPFSLAGRLTGLSEACGLTLTEPELVHVLLEKCADFLIAYARAFRQAGADGMIMAEPAAGLLSPKGVVEFSSAYVKRIIQAAGRDGFEVILHNCGARPIHLPAILEAGARIYHFGKVMDIAGALGKVPADTILCGNLDPAGVFLQSTPEQVAQKTAALLDATRAYRNFVISSGCDVPPASPIANLDAFFQTVARG